MEVSGFRFFGAWSSPKTVPHPYPKLPKLGLNPKPMVQGVKANSSESLQSSGPRMARKNMNRQKYLGA